MSKSFTLTGPSKPMTGWPRILAIGVAGFAIALMGSQAISKSTALTLRTTTVYYPAAYQLPKIPGGTSLRMAMLHDVLLERYLRHGPAWYEQRNTQSRAIIAAEKSTQPPSQKLLDAMDDLAVGLENLHHSDDAAPVMIEKLKLLPLMTIKPPPVKPAGVDEFQWELKLANVQIHAAQFLSPELHQQYTARANLGTSLIHANFPKLLAGDPAARDQIALGVKYIRESIALNPSAHFGRETWQALVVQHFLAAQDHPQLLTSYDIIGNQLATLTPNPQRNTWIYGLRSSPSWLDAHATVEERLQARHLIPQVGVSESWAAALHADITEPAQFDEPALALMGMWMLGGGPNPHAALALANIAYQVGQYEIAWDGYERALEMQDNFSPDEKIRTPLIAFCHSQQTKIAELKATTDNWTESIRQRHQSELAWAKEYQDDYHTFEAQQIAAGISLSDPHFYDAFFRGRPSIASPVGHVDEFATRFFAPDGLLDSLPAALLAAGLLMTLAALTAKPTPRQQQSPEI